MVSPASPCTSGPSLPGTSVPDQGRAMNRPAQGGSYLSFASSSRMCSAPQSEFSRLNLRISACIFRETDGLPGRDFQRQYNLNPALCHLTSVAGCMTCASFLQSGSHFESAIQSRRNESVNFGLGAFFCSMASVQTTSWLWTARSFPASTASCTNISRANRSSHPNAD